MDLRRIRQLAFVLIASQLRSGRSNANPKSLWYRPGTLLALDGLFFAIMAAGSDYLGARLSAVSPALSALVSASAGQLLAFLPLLGLGTVLVAGVMFELSTSSKFSTSDAANWLPITPWEYVLASGTAAGFAYSIVLSFALGVGLGLAIVTGLVGWFLLSAALSVTSLLFGGLLIEMLRSSTQRLATVVAKRTGRATLVLRILLFLVVILGFEAIFNPVFLLSLLQTYNRLGYWGDLIPVLWPSRAVGQGLAGAYLEATLLALGEGLLLFLAAWGAVVLRVRFWVPVAGELKLEAHVYAARTPVLSRLGLSSAEAALASKDFRGLVRRRELLPIVALPIVIAVFSWGSVYAAGGSGASATGVGPLLVIWTTGFFALLLASTSFGQERRAVQMLFAFPVTPRSIFRAKLAVAAVPPLAFGGAFWVLTEVLLPIPPIGAAALLVVVPGIAFAEANLGLGFAARWSDFQERPRPQFLRPLPQLAALAIGLILAFGLGLPVLFWVETGGPLGPLALLAVVVPAALAAVFGYLLFRWARRSAERFLRELPV